MNSSIFKSFLITSLLAILITNPIKAQNIELRKPEATISLSSLFFCSNVDVTLGMRLDSQRTWGIGTGYYSNYIDAIPATEKFIPLYVHNRHYYLIGKMQRNAICTEMMLGGAYCVSSSVSHKDAQRDYLVGKGGLTPVLTFRASLDFAIWNNFHI